MKIIPFIANIIFAHTLIMKIETIGSYIEYAVYLGCIQIQNNICTLYRAVEI